MSRIASLFICKISPRSFTASATRARTMRACASFMSDARELSLARLALVQGVALRRGVGPDGVRRDAGRGDVTTWPMPWDRTRPDKRYDRLFTRRRARRWLLVLALALPGLAGGGIAASSPLPARRAGGWRGAAHPCRERADAQAARRAGRLEITGQGTLALDGGHGATQGRAAAARGRDAAAAPRAAGRGGPAAASGDGRA